MTTFRLCSAAASLSLAAACLLAVPSVAQAPTVSDRVADLSAHFTAPPDDARPLMRWWWFGPAVVKPELEREIKAMKAGGFGGFEIQPVYPQALDDSSAGIKNIPYGSPEFLDDVNFVSTKARENGLRVDLTLASGWPYGGPNVPINEAAQRLRSVAVDVPAGATSVAVPLISQNESLLAVFTGDGSAASYDGSKLKFMPATKATTVTLPAATGARVALFVISSHTLQQVKRPAVGAEGFVIDHLSKAAIEDHLKTVDESLIKSFGANPPYSVFSDSLEVYATDWTNDFLQQFQRRRGYDLAPHLAELMTGQGPDAAAVRHDWGLTQTELVDENYLMPLTAWAKAHHTQFRSQTYGEPAVSMSSNRLVDLPEGEGPQWRSFSFTRWATSASHLYSRPVTSAETWTWLHSPAFRATPLDMKAEADRMFLEGVNQFIGHGWPYTPPGLPEPGWALYAAAVFNDHNPWWTVMPDVTSYLQRVSYALRQGKPANDVAVYLPNDDAYTKFTPGKCSLSAEMKEYVTPELTEQVLDSGYNLDYIDSEAIAAVGVPHPVLVLPHVTRMSPETLKKLADYVKGGGKIIAVGSLPSLAPGLANRDVITAEVQQLAKALPITVVPNDAALGAALKVALAPDMQLSANPQDVQALHRKLADADLYFVVNSTNHPTKTTATFRTKYTHATWLNPFTGEVTVAPLHPELDLAPYESRLILFSNETSKAPAPVTTPTTQIADLSTDWKVSFPAINQTESMQALTSWSDKPETRYYSGEAIYAKDITLTAAQLKSRHLALDFGPGTPIEQDRKIASGMRALLEGPIREAAVVMVNGAKAGVVWHPPYALDVTPLLHVGVNHIEIRVANTGINVLSSRPLPNYKPLIARYGDRFQPQNMDNLQPLPSGILGPIHLMGEAAR